MANLNMYIDTLDETDRLQQQQASAAKKPGHFIKIESGSEKYLIGKKEVVAACFKNNITSVYLESNNNVVDIPGDHIQTIEDKAK